VEEAILEIKSLLAAGRTLDAAMLVARVDVWSAPASARLLGQQRAIASALSGAPDRIAPLVHGFVELAQEEMTMDRTIFLVHGWDTELKFDAKNYLQTTLGAKCVVLHEQGGDGDTLIDKFERHAAQCRMAFVLLSDRDEGPEQFAKPSAPQRPRPNVLFEMGYFFARLGRQGVVLLRRGDADINTFLLGLEWIDVTAGVESAGEQIRRRIPWLRT